MRVLLELYQRTIQCLIHVAYMSWYRSLYVCNFFGTYESPSVCYSSFTFTSIPWGINGGDIILAHSDFISIKLSFCYRSVLMHVLCEVCHPIQARQSLIVLCFELASASSKNLKDSLLFEQSTKVHSYEHHIHELQILCDSGSWFHQDHHVHNEVLFTLRVWEMLAWMLTLATSHLILSYLVYGTLGEE